MSGKYKSELVLSDSNSLRDEAIKVDFRVMTLVARFDGPGGSGRQLLITYERVDCTAVPSLQIIDHPLLVY